MDMLAKRRSVFTKPQPHNFHFQNTIKDTTPSIKLEKSKITEVNTPKVKAMRQPRSKGSSIVINNDQSPMLFNGGTNKGKKNKILLKKNLMKTPRNNQNRNKISLNLNQNFMMKEDISLNAAEDSIFKKMYDKEKLKLEMDILKLNEKVGTSHEIIKNIDYSNGCFPQYKYKVYEKLIEKIKERDGSTLITANKYVPRSTSSGIEMIKSLIRKSSSDI